MAREDKIKMIEGRVEEVLPNMRFLVKLSNGMFVTAYLCGKMKMGNIRVLAGDTVRLEMSPYDLTQARIVYRQK